MVIKKLTDVEKKLEQQEIIEQQKLVEQAYKDNFVIINSNKYKFCKLNHSQRKKIFSYFTKIRNFIENKDFSFMGESEWDDIEALINDITLVNNNLISKIPNYWETNCADFIKFMSIAMVVISYPFFRESSTN